MRELPQEEDGEKKPRLPGDVPRTPGPADQGRHGARERAQQRAERSLALERGIDEKI